MKKEHSILNIIWSMARNTSQHILNTSADLLGFCLFIITSFHINNQAQTSLVDEFTSIMAFLFALSTLLSFFSIRAANPAAKERFETIADYLFIVGLIGILLIILFITLKIVRWMKGELAASIQGLDFILYWLRDTINFASFLPPLASF